MASGKPSCRFVFEVDYQERESGPPGARFDQFDPGADARRPGKRTIAGDEDTVEGFGKRHVDGVVGAQVVAQLPHAPEQWLVRMPLEVQRAESLQGRHRVLDVEVPVPD